MRKLFACSPYTGLSSGRNGESGDGAIVVLEGESCDPPSAIVRAALQLADDDLYTPVVVDSRAYHSSDSLITLARHAAAHAVPLVDSADLETTLRESMTDAAFIIGHVRRVLRRHSRTVGYDIIEHYVYSMHHELTRAVDAVAPERLHDGDAGIRQHARNSQRTYRRRAQAAGLPPPRTWLAWARMCACVIAIQRHSTTPIGQIALKLGYADAPGMYATLRRWGIRRPLLLRDILGWKTLLAALPLLHTSAPPVPSSEEHVSG